MTKIIAIIPARGGSKGIPNKNLLKNPHTGLRLIDYSIADALYAHLPTYVSTEDSGIKQYVKDKYGEGVHVIDRHSELSSDNVQVDSVVYFTILQLERMGVDFDAALVLQPTSPNRGQENVREAVNHWLSIEGPYNGEPSLMSVDSVDGFYYSWNYEHEIKPLGHDPRFRVGRQELDEYQQLLKENGAIYIASKRSILRYKTFRVSPIVPFFMTGDNHYEIDTVEDWNRFLNES
jgi:CMP-N,N'-diacetyllegionaminic acid synthase